MIRTKTTYCSNRLRKQITLPRQSYILDISLPGYHLFRSLEHFLKAKQFTNDNGNKKTFIDSKAFELKN